LQCILRVRELTGCRKIAKVAKIGKNKGFASARTVYDAIQRERKSSKFRERHWNPSYRTVRRIIAQIRDQGLQKPARKDIESAPRDESHPLFLYNRNR